MEHLGTRLLEAERIILRRIEEGDYKEMYENRAFREECSEFFPWQPADDMEVYRQRVAGWMENYSTVKAFYYCVTDALRDMEYTPGGKEIFTRRRNFCFSRLPAVNCLWENCVDRWSPVWW